MSKRGTNREILKKIEEVLDLRVRPELSGHGGDIESIRYEDGIYYYRLKGSCCGCPSSNLHTQILLKRELEPVVPDLKDVVLEMISQDTVDLAMQILERSKKEYESSR